MTSKEKLRAAMAATTAVFSLIGFQFFIILLVRGWKFFPIEAAIALVIGGLMGAMVFPKSPGKCVKVGVITGSIVGYVLIILASKDV